jgi:hypothetical protein
MVNMQHQQLRRGLEWAIYQEIHATVRLSNWTLESIPANGYCVSVPVQPNTGSAARQSQVVVSKERVIY